MLCYAMLCYAMLGRPLPPPPPGRSKPLYIYTSISPSTLPTDPPPRPPRAHHRSLPHFRPPLPLSQAPHHRGPRPARHPALHLQHGLYRLPRRAVHGRHRRLSRRRGAPGLPVHARPGQPPAAGGGGRPLRDIEQVIWGRGCRSLYVVWFIITPAAL